MQSTARLPIPLIAFDAQHVDLASVGGKGVNLTRLFQAGFAIPDGFIIPTSAYLQFIDQNQLEERIFAVIANLDHRSPAALEAASGQIRDLFNQGFIPPNLAASVEQGWQHLGRRPVAVRSSATAEDLPEMSFAGQQDTFLNIIGIDSLLGAVVRCWSSLWTARAIGYRHRNGIPHQDVCLSVIVQVMVESEASGVIFTANPLTGLRRQVVIDATLGLGEALVSGQVEPDHYTVDTSSGIITEKRLGAKSLVIHGLDGGGITTQEKEHASIQALPDEAIRQLAQTGKQIEKLYQFPQDIEWAWKDSQLFILQSRPITSLYPIPDRGDDPILRAYFSFGAVQGILAPMTPLGQDAIRLIFSGGAELFGFDQDHRSQMVLWPAGERLWADITAVLRHPIGARLIPKIFPGIEPGSLDSLKTLLADPHMGGGTGKFRLATFKRIFKFYRRLFKKARRYFPHPEEAAIRITAGYENDLEAMTAKFGLDSGELPLFEALPALFKEIRNSFIYAIPEMVPGVMVGLFPMFVLNRFSKQLTGSGELALELTRGLPNNVTTEMDIILWETAQAIKSDRESFEVFSSTQPEKLAQDYLNGTLPAAAHHGLGQFLKAYGVRGIGEIDIGRKRWREDPTPVIQTIKSYLKIEDQASAPDFIFQKGVERAAEALDQLVTGARQTAGGKVKAKVILGAARRLRSLGGLRESPKFYIIKKFWLIREVFLRHGEQLVRDGRLKQDDDLFFLFLDELDQFILGEDRNWKALIEERRANFDRERRRNQIPRVLASDGRTFYDGIGAADAGQDQFKGSPVSPGTVEGNVRVVLDPHQASLFPGEILVCPGTDPAWTPLFLVAGGLVMEVGGLMTHGAIVAREYGIPAVVGVNAATQIFKTGDRIRVNGSNGVIEKC